MRVEQMLVKGTIVEEILAEFANGKMVVEGSVAKNAFYKEIKVDLLLVKLLRVEDL